MVPRIDRESSYAERDDGGGRDGRRSARDSAPSPTVHQMSDAARWFVRLTRWFPAGFAVRLEPLKLQPPIEFTRLDQGGVSDARHGDLASLGSGPDKTRVDREAVVSKVKPALRIGDRTTRTRMRRQHLRQLPKGSQQRQTRAHLGELVRGERVGHGAR